MGRQDFSQPGSKGSGQTVAVSERPEITAVDLSSTVDLAAGESEVFDVYAPAGSIYKMLGFHTNISAPSGASSGGHRIEFRPLGTTFRSIINVANFDEKIYFDGTEWTLPDNASPNVGEIGGAIERTWATENQAIEVTYRNDTDVDMTDQRFITLIFQEVTY